MLPKGQQPRLCGSDRAEVCRPNRQLRCPEAASTAAFRQCTKKQTADLSLLAEDSDEELDGFRGALYKRKDFLGVEEEGML